ncbi:helix-turn-helix domain-containing protein [Nonomuraea sp. NPDC052265]|uniref:helix-turn-helix domain-containing protein n=1 Tax=Nonomuraea sp. NPDC052265 TaxID=3364374 RepID=UPI0037C83796
MPTASPCASTTARSPRWTSPPATRAPESCRPLARCRPFDGGRPAALDAHGVEMARALHEMRGEDGKRRYTVQQIADRLGVSRATIYRHLDPDNPVSA